MIPKRIIIVASGYSIRENLWNVSIDKLPIWNAIKDEFKLACNWSYKWADADIMTYSDYQMYETKRENLKNLPIIVGATDGHYFRKETKPIENNTYLFPACKGIKHSKYGTVGGYWDKEGWSKGLYTRQLVGIQAISLAILLGCTELFLLGYDACCDEQGRTHFYQDDKQTGIYKWNNHEHNGMGKDERGNYRSGNYNKIEELNNFWFKPFEKELQNGIQIYNVSLDSKIDTFPKISYKEFYKRLKDNLIGVNHEELQKEIKKTFRMQKLFTRSTKKENVN